MAQKTVVTMVSDLSNEEESEDQSVKTIPFGLDGSHYEIDLLESEATTLRDALAEYVAAARRQGRAPRTSSSPAVRRAPADSNRKSTGSGYDRNTTKLIREWAKTQEGMSVSDRGRIAQEIIDAWEATLTKSPGQRNPNPIEVRGMDMTPKSPSGLSLVPETSDPQVPDEPRGRDGLTRTEREHYRKIAQDQGMDVKPTGNLKKDVVESIRAAEGAKTG